jgi:hypothetical protein
MKFLLEVLFFTCQKDLRKENKAGFNSDFIITVIIKNLN